MKREHEYLEVVGEEQSEGDFYSFQTLHAGCWKLTGVGEIRQGDWFRYVVSSDSNYYGLMFRAEVDAFLEPDDGDASLIKADKVDVDRSLIRL